MNRSDNMSARETERARGSVHEPQQHFKEYSFQNIMQKWPVGAA